MKCLEKSLAWAVACFVLLHWGMAANLYAAGVKGKSHLSVDGPYILHRADGSVRIVSVGDDGSISDTVCQELPSDYAFTVKDHKGEFPFTVTLRKGLARPAARHSQPDKVFVMSDPHGKLDCVVSLLQANGVIDSCRNWSFGKNHLVVIGDVFDRGKDVTQILWLFYKLEGEAEKEGGCFSFLLGNHESMVLAGDMRYAKDKYRELAEALDMPYSKLFGPDSELGRWLALRNTMQTIGTDLYVHAGIGSEFYLRNLGLDEVNRTMGKGLLLTSAQRRALSPLTAFLYGTSGPLWYRGLVSLEDRYQPLSSDTLRLVLKRYGAERIIVGHTEFSYVTTTHRKRVVAVNVDQEENREKKRGRGLLIEGGETYVVGDSGVEKPL